MSTTVPWKEASSLIIVARSSISEKVGRGLSKTQVVTSRVINPQTSKASSRGADYRLLMVKRSGLSSFLASAFVFPGGNVEVADYSPKWWSVFENLGVSRDQLENISKNVHGPRPPMITDPLTVLRSGISNSHLDVDFLHADIALRIAAIRETFEETGMCFELIILLINIYRLYKRCTSSNTSSIKDVIEYNYPSF